MNYKGIQVPLTRCNSENGDLTQELHTIVEVTFDPCIVTFENNIVLDWNYTKEQFDNYIQSLTLPTLKDVLTEFFKNKEILIGGEWYNLSKLSQDSWVITEKDSKEFWYQIIDVSKYKVR